MYGIGMPILFPVAALNFLNQWICERIIVSYYVRLPPALDDTLTNNAVKMLKGAPIIMIMNAYWMVSNNQIFDNKWYFVHTTNEN